MDDRGTPINKGPIIGTRDVDLYKLFKVCVEGIKCPLLCSYSKPVFFFSSSKNAYSSTWFLLTFNNLTNQTVSCKLYVQPAYKGISWFWMYHYAVFCRKQSRINIFFVFWDVFWFWRVPTLVDTSELQSDVVDFTTFTYPNSLVALVLIFVLCAEQMQPYIFSEGSNRSSCQSNLFLNYSSLSRSVVPYKRSLWVILVLMKWRGRNCLKLWSLLSERNIICSFLCLALWQVTGCPLFPHHCVLCIDCSHV